MNINEEKVDLDENKTHEKSMKEEKSDLCKDKNGVGDYDNINFKLGKDSDQENEEDVDDEKDSDNEEVDSDNEEVNSDKEGKVDSDNGEVNSDNEEVDSDNEEVDSDNEEVNSDNEEEEEGSNEENEKKEKVDADEENEVSNNEEEDNDVEKEDNDDEEEEDNENEEDSDDEWSDENDGNSNQNGIKPQLKLHEDLSEMSFADLITLKNKLGTKVFNQTAFKNKPPMKLPPAVVEEAVIHKSRKNKNKPLEVSSKLKRKSTERSRIPAAKRYEARDPRFEEMCGELKQELFVQSYDFINHIKHNEKMKLIKLAQKEKDPEKKIKISQLLKRMKQQETSKKQQEEEREKEKKRRKEESGKVSQGKKPYFLKRSVQKQMREEERVEEVTKGGGLQKYLKRKEKKMLAKDRKKLSFL